MDWFTAERIDRDTYAISEYRHWEETHCYLLLGEERAVLIDTGLGIADIREVVKKLTELPVLVLTTHVHWDHIGGHRCFPQFAVHEAEVGWISGKFPLPLQAVKENLLREPCTFPQGFDPEGYRIFQGTPARILRDNDRIELGGRSLTVLHTPGHSPGHCCFYEPERKYLFAGDLIYQGCLDAFYPTTDPVLFMKSVHRMAGLSVEKVLPGHHQLHISPALIGKIDKGFQKLYDQGRLEQGNGVFSFPDFSIHL